jgi:D-alanyl-D-alanine-carboxypeptidase/D-alanyl-D-alanine-endopeptidase
MSKRPLQFLFTLMLLWAAAVPPLCHGFDDKAKIDPFARPWIHDKLVVGLVIGIVKDGQSQMIPYGETRKNSGIRPDGNTLYEIGSISKVFTGILLSLLVEAHEVSLEDPLQKFLPPSVTVPVFAKRPITLEHLATHTSGLPRMPDNFHPADPLNPYADYTVAQMYAFLKGYKLKRPPGKYAYSNYGMGLLGHVLAHYSGETYEQLLKDRICIPLGMKETGITLTEAQRKRLAPPYTIALNPTENWDIPTLAGAGAIRSSANDMIKFIRANLKNDRQPLTRAMAFARIKRHTMEDGLSMGLGWHLARDGKTLWHNGGTGGYHGWLAIAPERGVGVVVLANTANMRLDELGEQVTRIALGAKVDPPKSPKTIRVDPSLLESYAGYYTMTPDFGLTVTWEGGHLMVQATGQERLPVFARSQTRFFYKVVDAEITFVADREGEITKLILHQNGRDMEAIREK